MKMHKKLFGLLATAAVGLTLTSCGGGGGGGGSSDTPTDTEDTPVVEVYGAPESLVGKTLTLSYHSYELDAILKYEFSFASEDSFTGKVYFNGDYVGCIEKAKYRYERAGDATAYLQDVVIEDVRNILNNIAVDNIVEGNMGTITLRFDVQTSRLSSVDGFDACSLYNY